MPPEAAATDFSPPFLAATFPGTTLGVREALAATRQRLAALGVGENELFSAELVLAEVLNNVIEHALAGMEGENFGLRLAQGATGIHVSINDRGRAMPEARLPKGAAPPVVSGAEALPEGGFGWFLIRAIARDLSYRRVGGENRLSFRLSISVTEGA